MSFEKPQKEEILQPQEENPSVALMRMMGQIETLSQESNDEVIRKLSEEALASLSALEQEFVRRGPMKEI